MLDNFIYEDHLGRQFVGLDNNVYLNYSELRDYSWSYDVINNKIARLYRSTLARKIPLVIHCKSDAEAIVVKNRLFELTETDIFSLLPGKIRIGDYYTVGYVTQSVKSDYLISKRLCKLELTLTSDNPAWYRESVHVFVKDTTDTSAAKSGIVYPYDYPYDYAPVAPGKTILCESIGNSAFKLLIYGSTENPSITIGGHTYTVKGKIEKGETLLIDSLSKTITLTTANGVKRN